MELNFQAIEKSDADQLATWLSSEAWPYFLGKKPTKEEVLKRVGEGDFFSEGDLNFWVRDSQKEPIGLVEIYQLDDLAPMFSMRFKSQHRGKGYGKKTLEWLTQFVFENYSDKRRIEGQTREDNIPMRKVFNKCGYAKEAYYRKASPTENGDRVASIAYGILREDWQSNSITPVQWESDSFFNGDNCTEIDAPL
jgi:RimJ/RimL family protein N-acetyltransferase